MSRLKIRPIESKDALLIAAAAAAGAGVSLLFRRQERQAFAGHIALITGGSRGLGLSLAREFAAQGARVAICARNAGELAAARRDLESRGADVFAVECDVSDKAQVESLLERVIGHFGRIDILVNNAGEIQVGPVESMTLEDFERAMQVMFWGVVYPTITLLPRFLNREAGWPEPRIVNITSIGGKVAVPHLLPYTCAKFAAVGFSEGLHAEMAGKGIHVVTIAPGLMRTGSYLNALFKGDSDKEAAWFSLGASAPGVSMSGARAARQIVSAAREGKPEKILTAPASAIARVHGMFPGLTTEVLGLAGRLFLPAGSSQTARRGRDTRALQSPWISALTVLGRIGARKFLQSPPRHAAS